MRGKGQWADHIQSTFALHTARLGLNEKRSTKTTAHFRRPPLTPRPGRNAAAVFLKRARQSPAGKSHAPRCSTRYRNPRITTTTPQQEKNPM
jgi:hypothetical protein